jgi:hypothetical protein
MMVGVMKTSKISVPDPDPQDPRKSLGLSDADPLVRGTDLNPDLSTIKQN